MNRAIKLFFIIIPTIVFGFVGFLYTSSKPRINHTVKATQIKNAVETKYDEYGVPHIYADNEEDAYFSLGYSMGRDRLWQMEILRRAAAGRLSEILGEKTIEIDILMRKLMIRRSQEEYLATQMDKINPQALKLSAAFINGLNHYIETENLSLEFKILQFKKIRLN